MHNASRLATSLPTCLTVIPLFLGLLPSGVGCSCDPLPPCAPHVADVNADGGTADARTDVDAGEDAGDSAEDPVRAHDAGLGAEAGTVMLRLRAVGGGFVYARPEGREGEGISVRDMQTLDLPRGVPVTLDAFGGDVGARFLGWSGDLPGCTGSTPTLVLAPTVSGECVATFAPLASPCDGVTRLAPFFPEFFAVDPVTRTERGLIGSLGLQPGEDLRVTLMNADEFPEGLVTVEASAPPAWRESREGVDVVLPTSLSGARACTVLTVRLRARDCGLSSERDFPLRLEPRVGACP